MPLTVVGLGPGPWAQVTPEARHALAGAGEIWVRGRRPLALGHLPAGVSVRSLSRLGGPPAETAAGLAERLLARARKKGVLYAVPGHPREGEAVVAALIARCQGEGQPLRIVPGLSLRESPALAGLPSDTQLVDCLSLSLDPSRPAVVAHLPRGLSSLGTRLGRLYPPSHPLALITPGGRKRDLALEALAGSAAGSGAFLYLPPAAGAAPGSFAALEAIIARLRSPQGCPWDREQTHASLKPFLLEEAYEALEALDLGDPARLREELGDVLLQIMLHAQIGAEAGEFTVAEVIGGLSRKLIHRHPHVFGGERLDTAAAVSAHWDELKKQEKGERGLLEGIPKALPALAYSQELQRRAARAGFDWPEYQGILEKVVEELSELRRARGQRKKAHELGDILFAVADAARWLEVDLEEALRLANQRFTRRFGYMEEACRRRGMSLAALSFTEQNALWDEAKAALNDR